MEHAALSSLLVLVSLLASPAYGRHMPVVDVAAAAPTPAPAIDSSSSSSSSSGSGSSSSAIEMQLASQGALASNSSISSGFVDPTLPSSAYLTVAIVGTALIAIIALLTFFHYRKTKRRELEQQHLQEQRALAQQQQQAEEEMEANKLRPVFIPPIILNPDCSVHLGSVYLHRNHNNHNNNHPCSSSPPPCGTDVEEGVAAEGAAEEACAEACPADRSVHGCTVFVRACESAFAQVSLEQTFPSVAAADASCGGVTSPSVAGTRAAPAAPAASTPATATGAASAARCHEDGGGAGHEPPPPPEQAEEGPRQEEERRRRLAAIEHEFLRAKARMHDAGNAAGSGSRGLGGSSPPPSPACQRGSAAGLQTGASQALPNV